jgi:heme/copper-type cytochrome/quinol oxidase subunit 3
MERAPVYLDVSPLPKHAFGSRDLLWWGTWGFMVIEGTMFAMLVSTLFYLRSQGGTWPPEPWAAPDLFWGNLNAAIMVASVWPTWKARRAAEARDAAGMRLWMVVADLFGAAFCVGRWYEFRHLNVLWDSNAYGSVVWLVLGFHTTHLLTDVVESWVLTWLIFKKVDARRYVDVSEDCFYWYFVVLVWLPLYFIVYWMPRLVR